MRTHEEIAKQTLDEFIERLGYTPSDVYDTVNKLENVSDLRNVRLKAHINISSLEIKVIYVGNLPIVIAYGSENLRKNFFDCLSKQTGISFSDHNQEFKSKSYTARIDSLQSRGLGTLSINVAKE